MAGHEAIGVADPVVPFVGVLKGVQKVPTVGIISEDGLLLIPSGGYMVDSTGVFYAEGAGHNPTTVSHDKVMSIYKT